YFMPPSQPSRAQGGRKDLLGLAIEIRIVVLKRRPAWDPASVPTTTHRPSVRQAGRVRTRLIHGWPEIPLGVLCAQRTKAAPMLAASLGRSGHVAPSLRDRPHGRPADGPRDSIGIR